MNILMFCSKKHNAQLFSPPITSHTGTTAADQESKLHIVPYQIHDNFDFFYVFNRFKNKNQSQCMYIFTKFHPALTFASYSAVQGYLKLLENMKEI